ncbi:MAG TPA: hypothetical protein PLH31_12870, partial [Caulobacter sp.]|nr:hypothetical protein [Caulobacter sp.]
RLSISLMASTCLLAPAFAQDVDATSVEAIIVTGKREAQRAAIAVKRETFSVSDVVSADEIGKLPDHNTAAALPLFAGSRGGPGAGGPGARRGRADPKSPDCASLCRRRHSRRRGRAK